MEDVNIWSQIFLTLTKIECGFQEISSREIRRPLILSDIYAAVAIVDAKAPQKNI